MNKNTQYFAHYEAIAAVSRRMLTAARGALWSELVGLRDEYVVLVDGLKEAESNVSLDDMDRARKYALVRQILDDDAAIRDLASPSLARLSALFLGPRPARQREGTSSTNTAERVRRRSNSTPSCPELNSTI